MMPPLPEVGGYVYNESGLMLSVSEEAAVERLLLAYGRAVAEACICEIERLRAEVAALTKDAERYRWLRENRRIRCLDDARYYYEPREAEKCDAAIDAAMKDKP
jgi:hypothetical protein